MTNDLTAKARDTSLTARARDTSLSAPTRTGINLLETLDDQLGDPLQLQTGEFIYLQGPSDGTPLTARARNVSLTAPVRDTSLTVPTRD
jgi:hypothetical protein